MSAHTCSHTQTTTSEPRGYVGSVACPPYTHENRAAHGAVCIRETCTDCGATRQFNSNGRHREYSPWSQK
jgi:hypothetical protein